MQSQIGLIALGFLLAFVGAGCRKPTTALYPERNMPRQTAQESIRANADAQAYARQAVKTVTTYLQALEAEKYTVAYELLSRASQTAHNASDFAEQGKQGMPSFDLKTATATVDGDTAIVAVQQVEDPATHGFHLVREDDVWKIVYQGGSPGSPHPEKASGLPVGDRRGTSNESDPD